MGIAVRVLTLPPHAHLPLRDVLCASDIAARDVVESLLRFLRDQRFPWDVIRFADVIHESPLAALRSERWWRVIARPAKTCDFLVCDRPYDTIMHSFSRNFRSNLTKARNKLMTESGVEFESVSRPGPDMQRCFAEFLEVEASGWKGSAGTGSAIKLHPGRGKGRRVFVERRLVHGSLRGGRIGLGRQSLQHLVRRRVRSPP